MKILATIGVGVLTLIINLAFVIIISILIDDNHIDSSTPVAMCYALIIDSIALAVLIVRCMK